MGKPENRPLTVQKWLNRSSPNFARVTISGSPTITQNFITMRSGVFDPLAELKQQISQKTMLLLQHSDFLAM